MKLLPHYFKWIGIGMLLLSIIFGYDDFWRGFYDGATGNEPQDVVPIFPEFFSQISDYVTLIGLLVYILAKNKTEDEFAQKLRFESAYVVLVLTIVTLLVMHASKPDLLVNPGIFLLLQMVAYLIIRSIKRGAILGGQADEEQG